MDKDYGKKLESYVRSIPDFPEEGIIFRDITTVLQDAEGLKLAIDAMLAEWARNPEVLSLAFLSPTLLGNHLFPAGRRGSFPVRR